MATGGESSAVLDSKVTCSVCLEPFAGRHPKILPCFHTFCTPCLNQLVDYNSKTTRKVSSFTSYNSLVDGSPAPKQASITCPTCRKVNCIPPGGVEDFQGNFYVDNEAASPSILPTAQAEPTDEELDDETLVELALLQLSEEEASFDQRQKRLQDAINARYTLAITAIANARDASLKTLSQNAQTSSSILDKNLETARDAHLSLLRQTARKSKASGEASRVASEKLPTLPPGVKEALKKIVEVGVVKGAESKENEVDCSDFQQAAEDFIGAPLQPKPDLEALVNEDSLVSNTSSVVKTQAQSNADTPTQTHLPEDAWKSEMEQKLAQLCDQLTSLTNKHDVVEDANKSLRHDLTKAHDNNAKLVQDLHDVKKDVDSLRHKQGLMNEEICSHGSQIQNMEAGQLKVSQDLDALSDVKNEMKKLQGDTKGLQSEIGRTSKELATLKSQMSKAVTPASFSAVLGGKQHVTLSGRQRVVCERVICSQGSDYNPSDGIFTASVGGVYLFLATASPQQDGGAVDIDMKHNFGNIAFMHARDWGSSSCHAVVNVNAGETIYLEVYSNCVLKGDGRTSFTGMLLQPRVT